MNGPTTIPYERTAEAAKEPTYSRSRSLPNSNGLRRKKPAAWQRRTRKPAAPTGWLSRRLCDGRGNSCSINISKVYQSKVSYREESDIVDRLSILLAECGHAGNALGDPSFSLLLFSSQGRGPKGCEYGVNYSDYLIASHGVPRQAIRMWRTAFTDSLLTHGESVTYMFAIVTSLCSCSRSTNRRAARGFPSRRTYSERTASGGRCRLRDDPFRQPMCAPERGIAEKAISK